MQIIFHVWLADSMEGPTPVSALIHAATLVTAGIYVMVRLSIFDNTLVLLVGSLTALMGGIFGLFQNDLKRVIAFSTCSQLGYMMVSVGLGEHGVEASMSHLMSHASFKAGLFLAAGVVIVSSGGYQKLRISRLGVIFKSVVRSNLDKPYSLKCIIVNKNYRTILTNKWAIQSILLNNINNIRNYTTALPEDSLNSTVRNLLPVNYVERFSNLTPDVRYWIKKKNTKVSR